LLSFGPSISFIIRAFDESTPSEIEQTKYADAKARQITNSK